MSEPEFAKGDRVMLGKSGKYGHDAGDLGEVIYVSSGYDPHYTVKWDDTDRPSEHVEAKHISHIPKPASEN